MTTFNAYYRITVRNYGNTAAQYNTADYVDALSIFLDYAKGYGEHNTFLRSVGNKEKNYIITLDIVNVDTKESVEIRKMEV